MVGQLIYLQDSLLEGIFLLSIAPEFIRGYLSHKIETHRNDILWKGILEDIFPDFLTFFIPDAPEQIDFERRFEFLDKELEQLERQPGFPPDQDSFKPRHIDKLVKVFTRQGDEHWVLIHAARRSGRGTGTG